MTLKAKYATRSTASLLRILAMRKDGLRRFRNGRPTNGGSMTEVFDSYSAAVSAIETELALRAK